VEIHVKGTAFLKNMVRIIAGTLVDIGRGHLLPDAARTALHSKKRSDAGQTAPAKGLTLMEVYYQQRTN
jgi:tRNA pseudouridine38-40 synthase